MPLCAARRCRPRVLPGAGATLYRCNQLGAFGLNQEIRGWSEKPTWQAQFTATQTVANILGASQMVVVFEGAVDYIPGLEDKFSGGPAGRGLRYNGPGTSVSGNPELASRHFGEVEPADRFPDSTSWGYRPRRSPRIPEPHRRLEHRAALLVVARRDGHLAGPGGNFVEGRHGLTLGVSGNLRGTYELDVSWTEFGGAGRWNDLNDRDFVAASVKVSF